MPTSLLNLLQSVELAEPLQEGEASPCASELSRLSGCEIYPRSVSAVQRTVFALGRVGMEKHLCILSRGPLSREDMPGRSCKVNLEGEPVMMTVCPAGGGAARTLRTLLPFLVPRPLGLSKSVGCGDRLGLATPGHVRAVRRFDMAPIFAQQSIRENARTGRTPQQVMDEAMWGVLQEGWRGGFGADADHLKTAGDVDQCVAAGYTFYTFDPGEHVDNAANNASPAQLLSMSASLPWPELESTPDDLIRRLGGKPVDLGDFQVTIDADDLMRAAAKYGRAVAHTVKLYRHLSSAMNGRPFELEMSVDETDTVTTLAEHIYIATELRRLQVRWVSLAPRYLGTFEKGVDYIGDLGRFESSFAQHAAVARAFGPYKLSLHSGSDKFSVYPIASRVAGDLVHLKTAGTSYLEALRAIASLDPALFRDITRFAIERYPVDRASYHVSADQTRIADISTLKDGQLGLLLDEFNAREVLHVTFGSVLRDERFNRSLFATLRGSEETYYRFLENHFVRHIAPFAR